MPLLSFKWHLPVRPTDCTFPLACFARAKLEADGRAAFIIQVAFHRPPPQPITYPLACFAAEKQEAKGRAALSFKWHLPVP